MRSESWYSTGVGLVAAAAAAVWLAPAQRALAQSDPGPVRTVTLFDKLCYEMVPNLAALQKHAARLKWAPITGAQLQRFKPAAAPRVLRAWSFNDLGVPFRIAVSQSAMDAQAKKQFPAFAAAQVYSCSLLLPARSSRASIAAAMQTLMKRKPDESLVQGGAVIDSWHGQDKTRRVTINHIGAKSGRPGGLISVTLMIKP